MFVNRYHLLNPCLPLLYLYENLAKVLYPNAQSYQSIPIWQCKAENLVRNICMRVLLAFLSIEFL